MNNKIFQTCHFESYQMPFKQNISDDGLFCSQTKGQLLFLFSTFFYHIWNEFSFRREVQMRLPTPIFSKFSTVSVMVIYGKKVNSKCLYTPYMINSKVPHLLKIQFRGSFGSLILFNLYLQKRTCMHCRPIFLNSP